MIFGTGFPPFRGGLLKYADALGSKSCAEEMKKLTDKFGERFEPPKLLTKMANSNERFCKS